MVGHVPVLLEEIAQYVSKRLKPGSLIVDATFGAGGYTSRFLGMSSNLNQLTTCRLGL